MAKRMKACFAGWTESPLMFERQMRLEKQLAKFENTRYTHTHIVTKKREKKETVEKKKAKKEADEK